MRAEESCLPKVSSLSLRGEPAIRFDCLARTMAREELDAWSKRRLPSDQILQRACQSNAQMHNLGSKAMTEMRLLAGRLSLL